jgi:phosphoglycolate phosphatase-like HAD superfamily hydrolase
VSAADQVIGRARAVMVGDAVWDAVAARRAGIPCIGRDAGAAEVYPDAAALLGQLRASAIGRLGSGPRAPC